MADGAEHDRDYYFKGSPEERIRRWLQPQKGPDGHLVSGDWMNPLFGHITVHSIARTPVPKIVFSYTVQPDHCNRMGNLHGGCAATIFDYCTTLPLTLINKPGFWYYLGVSRTLNTTYLRPVASGEKVFIDCEIVQAGKRLCTLKGTMRRQSDGMVMVVCEHGKFNTDPSVEKI